MRPRPRVLIPPELDAQLTKAADRSGNSTPADPVECLALLDAPTADIDQMLTEIESGRI